MVAWWPGDGDAHGIQGGNNGTLQGGASFTAGLGGQGFNLDGIDYYVEGPDSPALDIASQITSEAWIKPAALAGRIVDKTTAGGADGYLLDTFGSLRLIVGDKITSGGN